MQEKKDIKKSKIPAFRTLKTDEFQFIKEKNISLVDIAARQTKAGIGLKNITPPKKYVVPIILILSVTIGLLGVAWFILFKKPKTEPLLTPGLAKPIIVAEEEEEIIVDLIAGANQAFKLKNAIHSSFVPLSKGRLIYLPVIIKDVIQDVERKTLIAANEFFNLIEIKPPDDFIQSLDNKFMLAKFQLDQNWPILIFKIKSYDYAFAGMLAWEEKLLEDLNIIFQFENADKIDTFFQDKELKNKDVRILNNQDGNPVLLYSFLSRDYLLITTGQTALEEIFRRFSLPQYLNG